MRGLLRLYSDPENLNFPDLLLFSFNDSERRKRYIH
jgi:hypothetical protein